MMAGRRCARAGCRAWAMRGRRYCSAHRHDEAEPRPTPDHDVEIDPLIERLERSEAFAAAVRAGQQDELIDRAVQQVIAQIGGERSLGEEIGALRIILKRVIALDGLEGDPRETAATAARLVDAIVRAVKTERALSGDLADDLSSALTTVLIEMGLGDE